MTLPGVPLAGLQKKHLKVLKVVEGKMGTLKSLVVDDAFLCVSSRVMVSYLFFLFSRNFSLYGGALLPYLKDRKSSPMLWISTATVLHRIYLFQTGSKISQICRDVVHFCVFILLGFKLFLQLFSFNSILLLSPDLW